VSNPPWTLEVPINGFEGNPHVLKLLGKIAVTELAELSNCSKGYISQVKHGIRPPSAQLIQAILSSGHYTKSKGAHGRQALDLFQSSRRDGLSTNTVDGFYRMYLAKAIPCLGTSPTPARINAYMNSLTLHRLEHLGRESLADSRDNEEPEGQDWSTLQPSHLPQNLRLSAQEGWSGHHDH
jgi:transcriptional regulator with XRE-family HTH domain